MANMPTVEVLPKSEYLLDSDGEWLQTLVSAYNSAYAFGHGCVLVLVASLLIVFAPFIGCFAAAWSFAASLVRTVSISMGRALSDELGYGEFVRTYASYISWKRAHAVAAGTVRFPLPQEGSHVSTRYPALYEDELGLFGVSKGWRASVSYFNNAFSAGFVAGTTLLTAVTFLSAPFCGAFVAVANVWYGLIRIFTRPMGSLLCDCLGLSPLLEQGVASMQEEMGVTTLHVAAAQMDEEMGSSSGSGPTMNPVAAPVPPSGTGSAAPQPPAPVVAGPAPPTGAYYNPGSNAMSALRPGTSALGYTVWSLPQAPPPGVVLVGGPGSSAALHPGAPSYYGTAGPAVAGYPTYGPPKI